MASAEVATIGSTFEGDCSKHHHGHFTGTFTGGGSEVISLDGAGICVTGTYGQASCGCWVQAIGGSTILTLNGLAVARKGDAVVEVSKVVRKDADGNDMKDADGNILYEQDAKGNPVLKVVEGGSITGTITSGNAWISLE